MKGPLKTIQIVKRRAPGSPSGWGLNPKEFFVIPTELSQRREYTERKRNIEREIDRRVRMRWSCLGGGSVGGGGSQLVVSGIFLGVGQGQICK